MKDIDERLKPVHQKDLELAKKIKPKLRKFVIDQQRQGAAKAAEEKKQEEISLNKDHLIKRACELSTIALLKKRVWEQQPPYLEMKWIKQGIGTPELIQELNIDISGFAVHLLREYNNYLKLHVFSKRGYLNPMDENNLNWFWAKFNADLRLLIETDQRRTEAGNQSVILVDDVTDEKLEIIKGKK